MSNKIIRALAISTAFLLVPFTASFFVDGWLWTGFDYLFAWIVFSFVSLTLTFALTSAKSVSYKIAAGVAIVATFLLVWINAAVGIIGEDEWPNLLYLGVVALGFLGAIITQLKPLGMARTLFTVAGVLLLIPVLVLVVSSPLVTSEPPGLVGVFLLNAFFAALFAGSALLFLQSARIIVK